MLDRLLYTVLFQLSFINNVLTYLFSAQLDTFVFKVLTEGYGTIRNPKIRLEIPQDKVILVCVLLYYLA